jgi:hypothetical protein
MCQESGLCPDDTPFVQCLMVLKELLAQRKLNEPYSGGLSSYSLLLLLTALIRERAAIREEQHRQTSIAGGGVPVVSPARENVNLHNADFGESPKPVVPTVQQKGPTCNGDGNPGDDSKPLSFADAVGKSAHGQHQKGSSLQPNAKSGNFYKMNSHPGNNTRPSSSADSRSGDNTRPSLMLSSADSQSAPSFIPQGFDDVIEVLCSGETTSGKLLMHFLLHYGQYFDATSTAIDISGKHERALTAPTPLWIKHCRGQEAEVNKITGPIVSFPSASLTAAFDRMGVQYLRVADFGPRPQQEPRAKLDDPGKGHPKTLWVRSNISQQEEGTTTAG